MARKSKVSQDMEEWLELFPTAVQRKRYGSLLEVYNQPGTIEEAAFQHSVLCQAFLPYRNPGDAVRKYEQKQGNAILLLKAGELLNPKTESYQEVGIPYGAKARLVLAYINTMAIRTQSPVISIEDTLTAFVRSLGLDTGGRTIKAVKDQLNRLAGASLKIGFIINDSTARTANLEIMDGLELWLSNDDNQRVLWPGVVKLSEKYYENLMDHAVPLDERTLAALANNAMALDIYAWLTQRLHRVPHNRPAFVSWKALSDQFGGSNYTRISKFRHNFRTSLKLVQQFYREARLTDDNRGLTLYTSPTPIQKTSLLIKGSPKK